jgi:raffinose/stachyose/melibiose transport system permease protein
MHAIRYTRVTFARELGLLAGAVVFCVPLYLLVTLSLKTNAEVYTSPLSVPTKLHVGNYSEAWTNGGTPSLGRAALNSTVITLGTVTCLIVIGSLGAYTLARRPSRLSSTLYFLFVLGFILPFQLAIIPIYVAMRHANLTGNFVGAITLYTGLLMPLAVFLYAGFVRALPKEYEEAAQVDGASLLRTFARVVFPLLRPITGTVALLTGLIVWNDFFAALIFLSGSKVSTLPLAIYGFVGENVSQWNLIFAGVAISIAPVLIFFVFAQKQLIHGFTGGIRG